MNNRQTKKEGGRAKEGIAPFTTPDQPPIHRQSLFVGLFLLIGVLFFFPALLFTAYIVFTGEVYTRKPAPKGGLQTWGRIPRTMTYLMVPLKLLHMILQATMA